MSKPLLAVLFLLSAGCSTETQNSETRDSNSNWLTACSEDADCDPEDTCVNERCHAACDDGHGCSGTASECRAVSDSDGCVTSTASGSGYCFVPCSKASDCDRLGDEFRCEQGVCSSEAQACSNQGGQPGDSDAGPGRAIALDADVPMSQTGPAPAPGAPDSGAEPEPAVAPSPSLEPQIPEPQSTVPEPQSTVPEPQSTVPEPQSTVPEPNPTSEAKPGPSCGDVTCASTERCCDYCLGACISASDDRVCPDDVAPERSCTPQDPAPSADAGIVPGDVQYSAQITGGIDCCNFYTVVKADHALDLCLFAEVREEVGSAPILTGASALPSADDCWNRLQEARTEASAISGDVSLSYASAPATATFQLVADFTDPPAWLPESVSAAFESLPLDGQWYPNP